MNRRQLGKRCLSLFLACILMFALAPAALAADAPWAADAVTALNSVYDAGTFSADNDSNITVADVRTLLTDTFGYSLADASALVTGADADNATRLQLSQVVCRVYGLAENLSAGEFPDCNDPAVITLRSLGIVVGFGDGNFHPEGTVTNAEFAVIFCRALGKAGAGGDILLDGIKPGAYGYDELMYLVTRGCLPASTTIVPNAPLAGMTLSVELPVDASDPLHPNINPGTAERTDKSVILQAWCDRLQSLGGAERNWPDFASVPDTFLDAVISIAAADRAAYPSDGRGAFSDVTPDSWYYDGVMYLFNNNVVFGYGDGTFGPNNMLSRIQLAVLICRIKDIDTSAPADGWAVSDMDGLPADVCNAASLAVAGGYMTYADSAANAFDPNGQVTRQEAAFAVFECFSGYSSGDVNLSVLDRFSDGAQVGADYQAAMAYLVSAGIINGNAQGRISPDSSVDRATFGVLLARVMMGLDKSKMHDYQTAVTEALS